MKLILSISTIASGIFSPADIARFELHEVPINQYQRETPSPALSLDEEIENEILGELSRNNFLSKDAKDISVLSYRGHVTLQGTVEDRWEKAWVEQKARSTKGVNSVISHLRMERVVEYHPYD